MGRAALHAIFTVGPFAVVEGKVGVKGELERATHGWKPNDAQGRGRHEAPLMRSPTSVKPLGFHLVRHRRRVE